MARSRQRTAGFTLLEALTATAVLASTLAIGIPNMARLRGPYALTGAAQRIAADLQLARQRAIARNTPYRITFDSSTSTYRLERQTAPGIFTADTATQTLPRKAVLGTITPGNPTFDTRGMLNADVQIPVSVSGVGSRRVTVNILGHVTIS